MSRTGDEDAGGATRDDGETRPLGPAAFAAELRRLDEATLAAFVADLWRARGREVSVDGTTVTVRRAADAGERRSTSGRESPGEETRTLAVTHRHPRAADADGGVDAVVTSRRLGDARDGPVAAAAIDADELRRTALYAVDRRTYADLCDRYFDRPAFVADGVDGGASTLRDRLRRPASALSRRGLAGAGLGVVLVVALVAGALPGVPGLDSGGPDAGGQPATDPPAAAATVTVSPSPSPSPPPAATDQSRYAAVGCPVPPTDAHPAALRPATVAGATASGLDGWTHRSASNVTAFHGRTDLPTSRNPEVRHVASYESPDGGVYKMVFDRWSRVADAERVATAMAPRSHAVLRWGRYTVSVTGYGEDGRIAPDRAADGARLLLAAVSSPGGSQLGTRCASVLLVARDLEP